MNKLLLLALFAAVSFVCVGEASAACGGGGWKKAPKGDGQAATNPAPAPASPAPASPPAAPRSGSTASATPPLPPPPPPPTFDARFRAVSAQLKLNDAQSKDVAKVRDDVASNVTSLDKTLFQAEEKFAKCAGLCEAETREVNKASEAQRAYNAKAEFEKGLKSILTASQWDLYSSAKVASTK